jgi:hypothetical protein
MRLSGGTIVESEMGSASPGFGRDGGPRSKRKKRLGGQRKPLKRLDSDKRMAILDSHKEIADA